MRQKRDVPLSRKRSALSKPRRARHLHVALLDHLLSTVPIGFGYVDRQFCYLRVSSALADYHGVSIDGHLGRSVLEIIGHERWSRVEGYYNAALNGKATSDIEVTHARIAAPDRHLVVSYYPVYDSSEIIGVGLGIKDITDRLQAERERMDLIAQIREAGSRRRTVLVEMLAALTNGKLQIAESCDALPRRLTPISPPVPLSAEVLSMFRHQVMDAAGWLGFNAERTADIVLAVGEALDNVLVHAGEGTAQVFVDSQHGILQVRVEDNGGGISDNVLHRAALERGYTTAGSLGHGFYLILNTCDRVTMLTGPTGTTMVLEQDKKPALPAWLLAG